MNKRVAASICRRAALLIEREGHGKGTFGPIDGVGAHCIIGALRKEYLLHIRNGDVATLALKAPAFTTAEVAEAVSLTSLQSLLAWYDWNDAPERTAKEVCRVLREKAYSLEHGGKGYNGLPYTGPKSNE